MFPGHARGHGDVCAELARVASAEGIKAPIYAGEHEGESLRVPTARRAGRIGFGCPVLPRTTYRLSTTSTSSVKATCWVNGDELSVTAVVTAVSRLQVS